MIGWLVAAAIGGIAAVLQYGRMLAPSGAMRSALGALRAIAVTLLVALLLDLPVGRPKTVLPSVYVDGSQSMTRGGAPLWRAALDSARAIRSDSTWVFGDTVRPLNGVTMAPGDAASRVRPVVERTMATGRPA